MNLDDPKFTAFLLDEFDDLSPADRAAIEALLANDPTAAVMAKKTRHLAALLRRELASEQAFGLTDAQRVEVLGQPLALENSTEATPLIPQTERAWNWRPWSVPLSIAAAVAVFSGALVFREWQTPAPRPEWQPVVPAPAEIPVLPGSAPTPALMPMPQENLPVLKPNAENEAGRQLAPSIPPLPGSKVAEMPAAVAPLSDSAIASGKDVEKAASLFSAKQPSHAAADADAPLQPKLEVENRDQVSKTERSQELPKATVAPPALGSSALAARPSTMPTDLDVLDKTSSRAALAGGLAQNKDGWPRAKSAGEHRFESAQSEAFSSREVPVTVDRLARSSESPESFADRGAAGQTAAYDAITDHDFLSVRENPLSTFSIDVDTASYAIVRRFLNEQRLPPRGAVRIEELINYFSYAYPPPQGDAPFSATMEVAACPWTPAHRLVRIGLKGREMARDQRPASNLVFLIDVSGSMNQPNKLPLLQQSLGLLIDQLGAEDQVAIVVYAGSSGCVLRPTHDAAKMRAALRKLSAGGSTNGASGIQLAYELAEKSFIKGGTNRVILATDGDWNVGVTSQSDLLDLIAQKAKGGVFLTVLGFGMDNLQDSMLVKLADRGNGNYAYIDTVIEARKVLVEQLSGTLVTIAKDVKIQVEFNPAQVASYRLIGYEKRLLKKEDFNDDTKDAGEIGAGHTVTALYEIVPAGETAPSSAKVDELKYQRPAVTPEPSEIPTRKPMASPELLTLKLRYKAPDGDTSKLLEFPLTDSGATWEKSSRDFRFAAAVASYGMLLRDSPHKGSATWASTQELASEGQGEDVSGYRAEFLGLIEKAKALGK